MSPFFPLVFWGAVPVLLTQLHPESRRYFSFGVVCITLSICAAFFLSRDGTMTAFACFYFGVVSIVPLASQNHLRTVSQLFVPRLRAMEDQRQNLIEGYRKLLLKQRRLVEEVDRLEGRFELLQAMVTKLEAKEILQSLGHTWMALPGVKACLLLRKCPNGSWEKAFAEGVQSPDSWMGLLSEHPELTRIRRIRRYSGVEKHPLFSQVEALPNTPFLIVPFSWDQEILAVGYVEVDPAQREERFEELSLARKFVAIGLRRASLYELMNERSRHDALTGAFLRRVMEERLQEAVRRSLRYKSPLFFVFVDIDFFKTINDQGGHLVGDTVLMHLVRTVHQIAEPGVFLARYGGDEFALILEMDSLKKVLQWLDRLRKTFGKAVFQGGKEPLKATLSIGVTSFWPDKPKIDELLERADKALYEAKVQGRNRAAVWPAAK